MTTNEAALTAGQQKDPSFCSSSANVFTLVHLAVSIFNIFITFGDAILNDPVAYDDLYYEIIRNADLFIQIYQLCLRTCSSPQSMSPSPSRAFVTGNGNGKENDLSNSVTQGDGSVNVQAKSTSTLTSPSSLHSLFFFRNTGGLNHLFIFI